MPGGIPEIFADKSDFLVEAGSLKALTSAMTERLEGKRNYPEPKTMSKHIETYFSAKKMVADVLKLINLRFATVKRIFVGLAQNASSK